MNVDLVSGSTIKLNGLELKLIRVACSPEVTIGRVSFVNANEAIAGRNVHHIHRVIASMAVRQTNELQLNYL